MSRKLHTLKEQYISNPTLPALIEYLEECKKEKLWEIIIETLENWSGTETPEIHFYNGVALLNMGKREEGAKELKKVVQTNPNHFAARREIEIFGINEEEPSSEQSPNEALKKILILEPKIENDEHYRTVKFKNISLLFITTIILAGLVYYFLREEKSDKYNELLKNPEANFTALSYNDYMNSVQNYKITDIREEIGDPIKKCILWMSAYAIIDYHLDTEKDDISQFKMFSTLVADKDKSLISIVDYIDGRGSQEGTQLYHKLDLDYPASLNQIKMLEIETPSTVTKNNLRDSFYKALMLFRRDDLDLAKDLNDKLISAFPDHELSQKLKIMIKARSAIKSNVIIENISTETAILDKWKTLSQERYFHGEAKILLGTASNSEETVRDGFYSVCPGRKFCIDIVKNFMKKGFTREASRMALYMKEQKENNRDADDIKLVMETSFADGDFSNCYFSFRELQQFFSESVDDSTFLKGAECSEKNGYFEEAVAAYEQINEKDPKIEITAKILRMKFRLSGEELYFTQLKELSDKNPENLTILYSFLDALNRKNNLGETITTLEKIYSLESQENKPRIIEEYLKHGAVFQAVKNLEQLKNFKDLRKILVNIYNRYMLFEKADELLEKGELHDPVWIFLKEQLQLKESGELEIVSKNVEKKMQSLDKCEPSLLLLKAEVFRNQGDKQRTFGMIDALLECDPFFLPGLVLAAEITYYQGDLTKAKDGIKYILDNEKFLSPGAFYYHNYLVLLSAEISVAEGRENTIMPFLKKNLIKDIAFGPKEQDKIEDISEKLKESKQQALKSFLRKTYKFSALKSNADH